MTFDTGHRLPSSGMSPELPPTHIGLTDSEAVERTTKMAELLGVLPPDPADELEPVVYWDSRAWWNTWYPTQADPESPSHGVFARPAADVVLAFGQYALLQCRAGLSIESTEQHEGTAGQGPDWGFTREDAANAVRNAEVIDDGSGRVRVHRIAHEVGEKVVELELGPLVLIPFKLPAVAYYEARWGGRGAGNMALKLLVDPMTKDLSYAAVAARAAFANAPTEPLDVETPTSEDALRMIAEEVASETEGRNFTITMMPAEPERQNWNRQTLRRAILDKYAPLGPVGKEFRSMLIEGEKPPRFDPGTNRLRIDDLDDVWLVLKMQNAIYVLLTARGELTPDMHPLTRTELLEVVPELAGRGKIQLGELGGIDMSWLNPRAKTILVTGNNAPDVKYQAPGLLGHAILTAQLATSAEAEYVQLLVEQEIQEIPDEFDEDAGQLTLATVFEKQRAREQQERERQLAEAVEAAFIERGDTFVAELHDRFGEDTAFNPEGIRALFHVLCTNSDNWLYEALEVLGDVKPLSNKLANRQWVQMQHEFYLEVLAQNGGATTREPVEPETPTPAPDNRPVAAARMGARQRDSSIHIEPGQPRRIPRKRTT